MEFKPLPDKYKEILHMGRPESKRPKMPMSKRAAQFAPFAALNGMMEGYALTEQEHHKSIEDWENRKY